MQSAQEPSLEVQDKVLEDSRSGAPFRWTPHLTAALLYAAITLLYTYPQVTDLSAGVIVSPIGSSSDYNIVMWDAWWVKKALIDLRTNPFRTTYLFYPNGASLVLHELTLLNSLLTIPFQLLMSKPHGIILGCNIASLLSFVIAGLGMFALVKYLIKDNLVAFFGGAAFAFAPYRSMHIVHIALLSTGFIPLYVMFLLKTLREKRWRNPLIGAMLAGATFLTCNMYVYFLALLTALFLVYSALFWRDELFGRESLIRFSILFAGSGLLLLPFLIAVMRSGAAEPQPEQMLDLFSANALGYILPADKHVFYRFLFRLMPQSIYYLSGVPGHATFLTFTIIGLAVVALVKAPMRRNGFWLAMLLVFLVLSLGTRLHFGKWSFAIPMPYLALYKYLPFFGVMRTPYRFVVPAQIGIFVLACYGLKHFIDKIQACSRNARSGTMVAAAFSVLLLIELWNIPFMQEMPAVPKIYMDIGRDEQEFAVMDLPSDSYPALAKYMYYQTLHEKPIPAGLLSRTDPQVVEYGRELIPKSSKAGKLSLEEGERLRALGFRYVIYHDIDQSADNILAVLKLY
ncbi:MAG: hypothetical protein C4520_02800 [Candidatus Abyssobacteria bacterium SURF_5]|uniref:Glycosyltransferase RgtA/B/C/D-like domain-containing protein n=1 Tax=Abyssobacteria bacterium (strain SURF_5) TaxID=2093360 RepID=A0A3A4NX70_ABYX5|nr:MAG: hypothetical protein C4520_02800 [Candidatus Abyssubacteria bacterium SURF_5]